MEASPKTLCPRKTTEVVLGHVRGSSGTYTITHTGSVTRCSCPAWTFQKKPVEHRNCKHLDAFFATLSNQPAAFVVGFVGGVQVAA